MSTVVVDASVAFKWIAKEQGSPDALALLGGPDLLIAPDLVIAEVCNVAWREKAVTASRKSIACSNRQSSPATRAMPTSAPSSRCR